MPGHRAFAFWFPFKKVLDSGSVCLPTGIAHNEREIQCSCGNPTGRAQEEQLSTDSRCPTGQNGSLDYNTNTTKMVNQSTDPNPEATWHTTSPRRDHGYDACPLDGAREWKGRKVGMDPNQQLQKQATLHTISNRATKKLVS